MNTGLIQTLLESVQALQASVKAIEAKLDNPSSMVAVTPTEAPESGLQAVELPVTDKATKKHPLEDYKITQKDIGSLVAAWDNGNSRNPTGIILTEYSGDYGEFESVNEYYDHAKPHLDPVALHFKAWHATDEDVPPSDLKDGDWVAVLFSTGKIYVDDDPVGWGWDNSYDRGVIIGYRPLSFVNPILDEEK